MRQHPIPYLLFISLAAIQPLLSSCNWNPEGADPAALYREAAQLYRHRNYPEALETFNRAIGIDTLKGFPKRAIDALQLKSRIEYMTGEYYEAFRTFSALERHAGRTMPDSLHADMELSRARMYAELGNFRQAASVMGRIRQPDAWQRLQQAEFWKRGGAWAEAAAVYKGLAVAEDPALRIVALAGLLDCSVARRDLRLETPDAYAGKIAAISGRVMSMQAEPTVRIRALRIAAKSLQLLEKQRPNASFLLFRALATAQHAGLARLDQILQYESNAVIVRKPDVYRSVIEYFGQRNMPYARMAAMFRLGMSPELTDAERIDALKGGLQIGQNYLIPFTATADILLENESVGTLEELLIANNRYFELFEVSEQAKLFDLQREMQASAINFRLPAGHESLQREIIELNREISGLLQRKINMVEEGSGFELSGLADKAISRKRGRLIELESEVSTIDKGLAALLRPTPVTMMTLQKSLRPDEALIRLFIRDSLATSMLISGREMQIAVSQVPGYQVRTGIDGLRKSLEDGGPGAADRLAYDPQRLWLTDILLRSLGEHLSGYRHLLFVADSPIPMHLLGYERLLGTEKRISILGCAKEAAIYSVDSATSGQTPGMAFFDASRPDLARIYKMFHSSDRVFLLWKPMSKGELADLEKMLAVHLKRDGSGSGSLRRLAAGEGALPDSRWVNISSYGID
ncbi:MAG: hypothetical protein HGB29_02275 [Chlorobiaceae bacterium]|nr:hypothetical protein [Chlorobiaceae bacterium]NTW73669.1 hypothetical protein [Chlorobiaceae bacterium]